MIVLTDNQRALLGIARRDTLPKFTSDKAAWQWIADELSKRVKDSAIPVSNSSGLCVVLVWMLVQHIITIERRDSMRGKLFRRFAPRTRRGEQWDGPFFWKRGVREPRVIAAQLMALLSRG